MIKIDMVTVLVSSALVSATLALAFLILGQSVLRSRALTLWGLSLALWAAGLGFLLARGLLPDLPAILLANGLLVLSQGLAWGAARVHRGHPLPLVPLGLVLIAFLALFTWYTLGAPNIAARIVIVRLVIAAFALATVRCLWPRSGDDSRSGRQLAALSFLPHATLMLITAAMGLWFWDPAAPFMAHPVILWSVTLGVIAHLLSSLGVLVMIFQRLVLERASANTVFQAIVEQSLAGIFEIRDGVVTYVNSTLARMFGYEPDDLIGLSALAVLIAPEDRERVAQSVLESHTLDLAQSKHLRFTALRKSGESFQVEVQGTMVHRDADTRVVMGVILDVTEQVAAERALRETRATLEARVAERTQELEREVQERRDVEGRLQAFAMAIEQSTHMVLFTDALGRVRYANPQFLTVRRVTESEILGRDLVAITPAAHAQSLARAIEEQRAWKGEIALRDSRGDSWVHATMTPVHGLDGTCESFVVIQTDISEQKRAQRDLATAKDIAELASRAKSELLANMSHELRTPLNAIIGFSEVMSGHLFGPLGHERYTDYAGDIKHSAQHLLNLINDILDVAALEAGRLALAEDDVPLVDLVESALRLVAERARQAELTTRVDLGSAQDVRLRVDARRIKQILLNLLGNAVKFTPAGGTLSLTASILDDGGLTLAVTDTGVGMNKEEVAIALSRFSQVDGSLSRRHEGAGLGLPLSQDLALMHGAVLEIDSEPGMGTTVSLTLPPQRVLPALAPSEGDGTASRLGDGSLGQEERLWV